MQTNLSSITRSLQDLLVCEPDNQIHTKEETKKVKKSRRFIFQVELELESSLGRGDIGQASWLTLPAIILILTALFNWDKVQFVQIYFLISMISKVSPLVTNAASNIERMVVARRAVSPGRAQQVGSS